MTQPNTQVSGASFQIFLVGGRDGLVGETSLISKGFAVGGCKPPSDIFFILSYFMCFLKPHEQGISAKIRYKN